MPLLYTHIYSVFTVAAEAATLAWWWWRGDRPNARRALRPWITGLAVVGVLYLPWVQVLANQFARVDGAFWIPRPDWRDLASVFETYAGSVRLAWLVCILGVGGMIALGRRTMSNGPPVNAVLLPWLVLPIALPFAESLAGTPVFLPKYTIAASVPLALLAGYGLMRLPAWPVRAPVAITLAFLTASAFTTYYGSRRREGWKDAVATVESLARPGDLVLFYPWFNQYPFDYYRTRGDLVERAFPLEPLEPVPEPHELAGLIRDAIGSAPRVWFVVLQGSPERVPIAAGLGRARPQTRHVVAEWLEVDLFERP